MSKSKPARRKMGRPTLCNEGVISQFERYLSASPYLEPVCGIVGISRHTVYSWLERGEVEQARQESGGAPDDTEAIYAEFYRRVTAARAKVETRLTGEILRACSAHDHAKRSDGKAYDAQGDPSLALAMLKHAFPERWGTRKIEARHEVSIDAPIAFYIPDNGRADGDD